MTLITNKFHCGHIEKYTVECFMTRDRCNYNLFLCTSIYSFYSKVKCVSWIKLGENVLSQMNNRFTHRALPEKV